MKRIALWLLVAVFFMHCGSMFVWGQTPFHEYYNIVKLADHYLQTHYESYVDKAYLPPVKKLIFEQEQIELQDVTANSNQIIEFICHNTSDKPITIEKIEQFDKEITANAVFDYPKEAIQPNATAKIKVMFTAVQEEGIRDFISIKITAQSADAVSESQRLTINYYTISKAQATIMEMPKTQIMFEKMEHDFGVIKAGDKVTYNFVFRNTGTSPLLISAAKGSCGCTVPSYPKDPIPPNGEGVIEVVFDSQGKSGLQTKTVTINANTDPNPTRLTIKAEIQTPQSDVSEELQTSLRFENMGLSEEEDSGYYGYDPDIISNNPALKHDFGTVTPNENLNYTIRFKNIGNLPFIADNIHCGCGCEVLKRPTKPILPNKSGTIKVRLNSGETVGQLEKRLYVNGNVPNNYYEILLTADVKSEAPIPTTDHQHDAACVPAPPSKYRADLDESNTIKVYPTHTSGNLTIDFPEDSGSAMVRVMDLQGRTVLNTTLIQKGIIELSVPSGVYMVQVETKKLKVLRKIEKF
jgi:hypothetical protein